jgi:hypothetical protein
MEWIDLLSLILFLMALLFGYLARTAKYVWRDKRTTRLFAVIAITCTLSVMILFFVI